MAEVAAVAVAFLCLLFVVAHSWSVYLSSFSKVHSQDCFIIGNENTPRFLNFTDSIFKKKNFLLKLTKLKVKNSCRKSLKKRDEVRLWVSEIILQIAIILKDEVI